MSPTTLVCSCTSGPKSYDKPLKFHLSHAKPSKTIDLGGDGISAALAPLGHILQINAFHPSHGIVQASPYEQFDGTRFRDQPYVRAYRRKMLESVTDSGVRGFGLHFDAPIETVNIEFQTPGRIAVSFAVGPISIMLSVHVADNGELVQSAVLSSSAEQSVRVHYALGLGISVNRASYGQLTEGGPIPIPASENHLIIHRDSYAIVNPHLHAHLEGRLEVDGVAIALKGLAQSQIARDKPVDAELKQCVDINPGSMRTVVARFRLTPDTEVRGNFTPFSPPVSPLLGSPRNRWLNSGSLRTFIIRRNLDYILGCLAVPVSDGHIALMADHAALPLGWNRDNYWQLWFVHHVRANLSSLVAPKALIEYRRSIERITRGHLLWVFERAERPHGFWHRSYLVTGKPKDGPTFQLDQQLYPLLELCDFYNAYSDQANLVRSIIASGVPARVLELVLSKRDARTGLYPTDETPGDDQVAYPYHFSSHVLLWHTLTRLARLVQTVGGMPTVVPTLTPTILRGLANEVRSAALRHFVTPVNDPDLNDSGGMYGGEECKLGSSKYRHGYRIFAYTCDGTGRRTLYHDANDLPTLFAPQWGFCMNTRPSASSQDEDSPPTDVTNIWLTTMDWALSPWNTHGYYARGEPFEALGSVHSPDPWTLGMFQELAFLTPAFSSNAAAGGPSGQHQAIDGDGIGAGATGLGDKSATAAALAKRKSDVWRRIRGCMLFDGMFSEAVDGRSGACTSKAWFAWPGSMIGGLLVLHYGA